MKKKTDQREMREGTQRKIFQPSKILTHDIACYELFTEIFLSFPPFSFSAFTFFTVYAYYRYLLLRPYII